MNPAALRSLRIQLAGHRQQALERSRQRLVIGVLLFAAVTVLIGLRLMDLAVLKAIDRSTRQPDILASVRPPRADILDRNGEVLATTLKVQALAVRPQKVIGDKEQLARRIVEVLPHLELEFVRRQMHSNAKFRYISRRLSPDQVNRINALGEPGLEFHDEAERVYPNGTLAAHVLGYTNIDGRGMAGIERAFDARLSTEEQLNKPLKLSIDVRVQHALEYELNAAMEKFSAIGAAGLVMDVHSGELLAMTSLPAFDPNAVSRSPSETWFNRATQGVYEQGSTFKIFTTAMGLEEGIVTLGKRYDVSQPIAVGRFRIRDYRSNYKNLSAAEVFMHSSNIGTALMAVDMGPEVQQAYFRKLGLLEAAQIELKESSQPLVPSQWSKVSSMTMSYGHGIAVTSLHVATGIATVVNGGIWRPATLMHVPAGTVATTGERIFSEQTSKTMRELMRLVVVQGTGKKADAPGFRIGGKTGTAEKPGVGGYQRKSLITTFAGAFPMDDPRYVVIATLDEPQGTKETYGFATAGWNAAPVMKAVVQRVGPILGVEPNVNKDVDLRPMQQYIAGKQT